MEDQVPSSQQYSTPGQRSNAGNYYVNPEDQRFDTPQEFDQAMQQQEMAQPPNVPDFKAMREQALQNAIRQVMERQGGPQPQTPPPGMELSMDGSQYVPQKYPVASVPAPTAQVTAQPTEQVRVVRRNLTLAELILVFVIAVVGVLGLQGIWYIASDIIPRIEIKEK